MDCETHKDRISDLQEGLLSHILSRLPTKDAVRTCVLSKTWEMKWNCIWSLDFYGKLLYLNQVIDKERFSSFVTKVLNHCGNTISQNFGLILSQKYDPNHIVAWISTALDHDVKSLYLHYDRKDRALISRVIFCSADHYRK
nr:F-box/LRR-repeat protein At4g14103-like [Coffea arabica]